MFLSISINWYSFQILYQMLHGHTLCKHKTFSFAQICQPKKENDWKTIMVMIKIVQWAAYKLICLLLQEKNHSYFLF